MYSVWSHDTGQQIPCFDSCQLIITRKSNIKDIPKYGNGGTPLLFRATLNF